MQRRITTFVLAGALVMCSLAPGFAEETVTAQGRVFEAAGSKPLADADIVMYDAKNNVIGHAKTDVNGKYTLSVPKEVLHLAKPHHGGNFLGGLVKGVGKVLNVAAPLGMTAMTGGLGSLGAIEGLSSLGSMASGTHSSAQSRAAANRMAVQARLRGRSAQMPGEVSDDDILPPPVPNSPGALLLKVSCADHADAVNVSQVYWLHEEQADRDGKVQKELSAWIDPVELSGVGSRSPSRFKRSAFVFCNARVEPSVAEYGQTVTLRVNLLLPAEPKADIVVVARNARTGDVIELSPEGEGMYKAEIVVDKQTGRNDVPFSVLAYARGGGEEGRSRKAEEALRSAGLWDLKTPYVYNPLIAVSRNRAEVTLTVVASEHK